MGEHIFYPDADPEATCCDGGTESDPGYYGVDWANARSYPANNAGAAGITFSVRVQSGASIDKWRYFNRSFFLFDTSIIPPDAIISEAKFRVYGSRKVSIRATDWDDWAVALVPSLPRSNTDIVLADHTRLGTTLLSNTRMLYDDWKVDGWNEFILNAAGLEAITKGGITKFGLREKAYDAANKEPPWVSEGWRHIAGHTAENSSGNKPELVVTYITSLPKVTTNPAIPVVGVPTSFILNGTLDDDVGESCACGFQWGETPAYGNTTDIQGRTTGQTFAQPVSGLKPGTTYNFRAFATNSLGTGYGANLTFTTVGTVYPTEAITRVTNLIHRYRPGEYTLEMMLGEVTTDLEIPGRVPAPHAYEHGPEYPGVGYFCIGTSLYIRWNSHQMLVQENSPQCGGTGEPEPPTPKPPKPPKPPEPPEPPEPPKPPPRPPKPPKPPPYPDVGYFCIGYDLYIRWNSHQNLVERNSRRCGYPHLPAPHP